MKQGKAESSTDARLTDESFSLLNFHNGLWHRWVAPHCCGASLGRRGLWSGEAPQREEGPGQARSNNAGCHQIAHVRGEGDKTTPDKIQNCQSFVTIV